MAVSSIRTGTSGSLSLVEVASQFRDSTRVSASSSNPLDSAQLSSSAAERAAARERQRALTTISDAASYISVADNAASEVQRLITAAASLTSQLESEVSEERRADLADEATRYIREIEAVADDAQYNGTSLVEAGAVTFSYELRGGDESSATDFNLSVPNIALSLSSLDLDNIDVTAIASDPEGVSDRLASAFTAAGDIRASLAGRATEIVAFAEKLGVSVAVSTANAESAESPEALAQQIANSVRSALPDTNNLDPLSVQDLLSSSSTSS